IDGQQGDPQFEICNPQLRNVSTVFPKDEVAAASTRATNSAARAIARSVARLSRSTGNNHLRRCRMWQDHARQRLRAFLESPFRVVSNRPLRSGPRGILWLSDLRDTNSSSELR